MKRHFLILLVSVASSWLTACDSADDGKEKDGDSDNEEAADDDSEKGEGDTENQELVLNGTWVYSAGMIPGLSDTLVFTDTTLVESVEVNGEIQEYTYDIVEYDPALGHMLIECTYSSHPQYMAVGDRSYGTFVKVDDDTLRGYYGDSDYPAGDGGTESTDGDILNQNEYMTYTRQ